ncbi:uncharacterized protein UBRO_20708 [Ustilago bromivora]|uniref:Uncharacterized protein n=1 Tax=Ustilago bromivora TaxID=307758 RepID=A0A1K0HE42_9BASI|nr:uncharacterized protein UBRO_20708 [Ustilago bromivora]
MDVPHSLWMECSRWSAETYQNSTIWLLSNVHINRAHSVGLTENNWKHTIWFQARNRLHMAPQSPLTALSARSSCLSSSDLSRLLLSRPANWSPRTLQWKETKRKCKPRLVRWPRTLPAASFWLRACSQTSPPTPRRSRSNWQ